MKVIALAASNSKNSINKKLATFAAGLLSNATVEVLDINNYEMPIFSEDLEKELGQPQQAQDFFKKLGEADVIIISYAEHNGSYTAAFKNLFDWTSRIDMKVYQNKKMVMLSTSPGAGGANSVLTSAVNSAPYFAAQVIGSLSVPNFYTNFNTETQSLTNTDLVSKLKSILSNI